METTIYYFTGTGNSLAVARDICERLGECRVVPIVSLNDEPGPIRPAAERVGIVYPVYFSGVPSIVVEIADEEPKIAAFLPVLDKLFDESKSGGLVTLEKVQIIRYRHGEH